MTKKTRLNKSHRELILHFGQKHIASSIDRSKEQKHLAVLLEGANAAIRFKYPEADMVVLRKYKLERIDRCLRFQFPSGRVDGFTFEADEELVDLPYLRGCGFSSNEVFPVSAAVENAFDEYGKLKTVSDKKKQEKLDEFYSFVAACQTVAEVLDVIPLPDDIRMRLGHGSSALVAVTPETVKSLKATFKEAA